MLHQLPGASYVAGQEEEEEMDELSGSKEMGRVSFEEEGYCWRATSSPVGP